MTTPYEDLSESMRRYYCDMAQRACRKRRVIVRRWWGPPKIIEGLWTQLSRNKSDSKTSELHCKIPVSRLPFGTRSVTVILEDMP